MPGAVSLAAGAATRLQLGAIFATGIVLPLHPARFSRQESGSIRAGRHFPGENRRRFELSATFALEIALSRGRGGILAAEKAAFGPGGALLAAGNVRFAGWTASRVAPKAATPVANALLVARKAALWSSDPSPAIATRAMHRARSAAPAHAQRAV